MTPNEQLEYDIQMQIFHCIDNFNSFRFNAGAGAGKTYALIETLKYVAVNKVSSSNTNQKIACVTYTNVAVNEIKNRLGNSDFVHVSTIHDRLWDIIKTHQPQLLSCHKGKIEEAIANNNYILSNESNTARSQFYSNLDDIQKKQFVDFILDTKDIFYTAKDLNAREFKDSYINNTKTTPPNFFSSCLTNVSNFKYVVSILYDNERNSQCLSRIDSGELKKVIYDSTSNLDRLYRMKFSHDTLLEYSLKLVEEYPMLCRIIIDKYPYFFIDEYQDTNANVVKFIKKVSDVAENIGRFWLVGYFGDTAQNIYNDGVGQKIEIIHQGLINIHKIFNRRSHSQVIDVINRIRDDEIIQVPIFESNNRGSIGLWYSSSDDRINTIREFLSEYLNEINDEGDVKSIHCLVLTNKLMTALNGFDDVYNVYSTSKRIFFSELNTKVLSNELEKLHSSILTIYKLVKLYNDIHCDSTSYYDIFGKFSHGIEFSKASLAIRKAKEILCSDLRGLVSQLAILINTSDVSNVISCMLANRLNQDRSAFSSKESFEYFVYSELNSLMNEIGTESEPASISRVENVLNLTLSSLIKWCDFIDKKNVGDIIYHTYHGTKGEEYQNVAIVLEHSFGSQDRDKFKKYFEFIQLNPAQKDELLSDADTRQNLMNTKNLLYVACSRAIKNLRVLYLDDLTDIQDGVNSIFGCSYSWPTEVQHPAVQF